LENRPSGDVSDEDIQNAVNDYLEKNPVSIEEKDPIVPAWAKQPEKPKYTAAEVGALPADTPIPEGVTDEQIQNAVDAYFTENPQGGEVLEDISSGELTEEVSSIVIDKDSDGNAFNLSKGRLYLEVVGTSTNTVDRGLIKFSHNYRGSGGGAVQMGTLTRFVGNYKEFAMGDYDFSLDGRGVVKYIATQATDQKAFMQLPLTKIYIDGTTENATMMGVGTRWLLRGVRK
jgi:hypothetical protein